MMHIMVLHKYLGNYGNETSFQKISQRMGISKGAVNKCVTQASSAILKLQEQVIKWPNEERKHKCKNSKDTWLCQFGQLDRWYFVSFDLCTYTEC